MKSNDVTNGRRMIVHRAKRLRAKILQTFTDCASWNDNVRKPDEPPINCDPDGSMRRAIEGLDRMLETEERRARDKETKE